jgi:hypothetical protein
VFFVVLVLLAMVARSGMGGGGGDKQSIVFSALKPCDVLYNHKHELHQYRDIKLSIITKEKNLEL